MTVNLSLNNMSVTIIATLYSHEPVIASVTKLGAEELILLMDHEPDKKQSEAEKIVSKTFKNYINIRKESTDVYDIVKIASAAINIIDSLENRRIILNVSAARKTKSLGLMFAGYARSSKIDQIIYVTKEEKKIIILPKLSFNLTKTQKKLLSYLNSNNVFFLKNLPYELDISRANLYKTLSGLKERGLLDTKNKLTEAGQIAIL